MLALEAQEHIQPPPGEAHDAKIIPFPVRAGVGEVAVGAFADSGIAVHQGSGTERYLTRQTQTPSAAPHSQEYSQRARELRNR